MYHALERQIKISELALRSTRKFLSLYKVLIMKKREFIKNTVKLVAGSFLLPNLLQACAPLQAATPSSNFQLPALPYAFDALEPFIDKETMEIHHGKHHAAYVNNLNKAIESHPMKGKELNFILAQLKKEDSSQLIRNNAGGHFNHSMFWKILGPQKESKPTDLLLKAIENSFGNFEQCKEKIINAGMNVFGSGWVWLSVNASQGLELSVTANQDNPLMSGIVSNPGNPILGIDIWEHAYYLKYQNKRKDYLTAIMNLIQWDQVSNYYQGALNK